MKKNRSRSRSRDRGTRFWATAFAVVWPSFAQGAPSAALAETPSRHRVLLLTDKPSDPFMDLVKSEISVVRGVEVVVRAPAGSLDRDARAEQADAAVRKLPSENGVEVWMADATSGRSLLRQLVVDESPDGPDHSLIALQTAELLRTSFFPKPPTCAPCVAPQDQPTTDIEAAGSAPAASANALQAGVGLLGSRGGVGPALQGWLSYQHLRSRHFGIVLDVSVPLVQGTLSGPAEGSADVGVLFVGGGLHACFRSGSGRLSLATSIGGAFASVLARGRPVPGLEGSSTRAYTGLAYLRLSGGFHPAKWLGLGLAGIVGTTTSRVRVLFAEQNVGEWGMPIVAAVLYSEVAW